MLSTEDAFSKFRGRLELNDREQNDASRRQQEIRNLMDESFEIEHDFLTGSYARHTKTKPLKDVDIFCVLGDKERHYRKKPPSALLTAVADTLTKEYGRSAVKVQRRSVSVDFGVKANADDETDYKVVSFDVVPAFALENDYEIPDTGPNGSGWTKTNPRVHADKATAAQRSYADEWKGLVRMMKYWNNNHDKPIKPSFLIEVMALEVLHAPYGGQRAREMQSFFATLAARIHETWNDPAGLGPPVSDGMDAARRDNARTALVAAEREASNALHLTRSGRQGEALRAWRDLFGPLFPLS
ncbi:MAG TPA: CBASS oligonucleotide cyclase [Gemmatimonadaceae bacterium]|nr:CBASS oligonucleotide cyclase [Gemmatimonadaceae bacterium]